MANKLKVAVLTGGQSAEHEVALLSATNVIAALDSHKYEVSVIVIARNGEWFLVDAHQSLANAKGRRITLALGQNRCLVTLDSLTQMPIDVVFPVLHGAFGEDGTVQGLLKLANIPFVGAHTLGSAICMDKAVSKQLLFDAGIPTTRWVTIYREEIPQLNLDHLIKKLGLPLFVKPANTGSSVGITKVKNAADLSAAIELALQYDHKILLEEFVPGREIECAVLGNDEPQASLPGEIIPHHEFYTYEAKYVDPEGATLKVPADLSPELIEKVQTTAKQAFRALCCTGMARVDFFIKDNKEVLVNELNTIPGFTNISMYPKMWMASGLSYNKLLDRLIELALDQFEKDRQLKITIEQPVSVI